MKRPLTDHDQVPLCPEESGLSAKRIPELDGIRGTACLLVLGWHYFGATLTANRGHGQWILEVLGKVGLSGVDLFFVLSGFLIGGILHDHRHSQTYFRTFYVRRVCRIFPVYFTIIGALVVALALGLPHRFPAMNEWLFKDLHPLWTYATFTQNFAMAEAGQAGGKWLAMTWSVAVEEQFYLLFPFVVRFCSPRQLGWLMIAGLVASPFLRAWASAQGWWFYTLLPCRFDCLGAGVLAALLARNASFRNYLSAHPRALPVFLVICLGGLIFVPQFYLFYTWLALFYAGLLITVVLHRHGRAAAVFRAPWLAKVGLVSYGVYMYHQATNGTLHASLLDQAPTLNTPLDFAVTALSVVITFLIAVLSFRWMERSMLQLGNQTRW